MSSTPPELGLRLLRAGAGAGKTTTLVSTFIDFVRHFRKNHQDEFPRIVVTTFTRKATQEVRERLMKKSLELGETEIFEYLGEKSRVHISTIHGILSLFLSRYGDRLGLPPDFRFVSEDELKWLSRRELRRILAAHPDLNTLLEDYEFGELWKALELWREKVLFTSGSEPVDPDWFREQTLKVLSELCEEAAYLGRQIPAQTKNQKLLEWGELLAGLGPCPRDDESIERFLDSLSEKNILFGEKPRASLSDEADNQRKKDFKKLWDPLTDSEDQMVYRPSFWRRHQARIETFQKLAALWSERVESLRRQQGLLSMADLETLSLQLVQKEPTAAESFSREWDYWMIDEYQDTSPIQVELLKHLVGSRPHFVVGDPQQSIYFFRGARSQVFFEKQKDLESQGGLVQSVVRNHRSRAPLLAFFNEFFGQREAFSEMEAGSTKPALPAEVPAAEFRLVPKMDEGRATTLAVLERVQALLSDPQVKPESICVLSRANESLRQIQAEARLRGLPVQLHTAGGFTTRREIRDVLCFLRFLLNPSDNLNFLSLLRSPWFHLEDSEIFEFTQAGPASYWSAAQQWNARRTEPAEALENLQAYLSEAGSRGLVESLKRFYRNEGLMDSSHFLDPTGRREANLWKILMQLEKAQRQSGFHALQFVDSLDQRVLSTEEGNEDGDAVPAIEPKRVQLMTIHASKGLEFEHVIITNLEKPHRGDRTQLLMVDEESARWTLAEKDLSGSTRGSLLSKRILEKKNLLLAEESLRVLYVAMTRAQQTVTLILEEGNRGNWTANSWASEIPFDLSEGLHQRDLYCYQVKKGEPATANFEVSQAGPTELRAKWPPRERPTHARSVSATELVEGGVSAGRKASTADVIRAGLQVAHRGTEAHRLFESLKYASFEDVLQMTEDSALRSVLPWMWRDSGIPLEEIIRGGHVEWGFAARDGDFILQGQVDLWGVVDGNVWIVDYKTGSTQASQKALDQMKIYAWALSHLGVIQANQPIHLVALYPLDKEIRKESFARVDLLASDWHRLMPQRSST